MEMKERMKLMRQSLTSESGGKMTQLEFARELGLAKGTVTAFETGSRYPADSVINLICTKYGVSKNWLLTGEGDMFSPKTHEAEIAEIAKQLFDEKEPLRKKLIELISGMSKKELDAATVLKDYIEENYNKKSPDGL